MAHKHSVYDTDTHFRIDGVTRAVKNASTTKTMVVQHDHNSERFTFEVPRMVDGHDMSICNLVQVHYINTESINKNNFAVGVYEVDDLQASPNDDAVVICSWLISGNATKFVGNLSFVVRFACIAEDGTVDYAWNTAKHSNVFISEGIYNSDDVAGEYADVLAQWEARIAKLEDGVGSVKTVNGVEPDENGNIVVEQVSDEHINDLINGATEERFSTVEGKLEKIIADLNYVAIDITRISCTNSGTHEIGAVIAPPTVSWALNKEATSQTLNSEALDAAVRSKAYDESITTNKTYTLKVTDERGATDTASVSISFLNGVYYGVMEDGATIDSAAVLKLTRELRGDRKKTFTANAGASQRHAFAIPTRYGTPTFKDSETGFQAGFYKASTIAFTNASGYTEDYDVWLSTNKGLGSMTVAVS